MTAANSPAQLQPSPRPAPGLAPERAPAVISLSGPIALSAEHAKVLLPTGDVGRRLSLAELHMQLSSEIKDPSWAPEAEQAIRQALAAGNASGEFELMNVECRASLCEVLAFGNLPSSGKRWNQLWDEMAQEEWYQSFKGNSTTSSARNGRYTIVTILERPKR